MHDTLKRALLPARPRQGISEPKAPDNPCATSDRPQGAASVTALGARHWPGCNSRFVRRSVGLSTGLAFQAPGSSLKMPHDEHLFLKVIEMEK